MNRPKKCLLCGGEMTTRREDHTYEAAGLAGVVLQGVPVSRCRRCREVEIGIPMIEGLHRTIAAALVGKATRLAPEEIRFLRKHIGLSSTEFARHMGTTPEAVSRWENGRAQMGPVADRLLRAMIVMNEPLKDYTIGRLREIGRGAGAPVRITLRPAGSRGWRPAAAAA